MSETPEEIAGRELQRLRIARGWSQEEAARQMDAYGYDWHQTTVSKIEAAQRPLRLNELADLASLYGVPLDALLSELPQIDSETLENQAKAKVARLERKFAALRQVFDALDEDRP